MLQFILFILTLTAITTDVTYAHEHPEGKMHSHFCEGASYNVYCGGEGKMKIDRAWYGRIAHDHTACDDDMSAWGGPNNTDAHPILDQDCGVSLMEKKNNWCQDLDKMGQGCTISVNKMSSDRGSNPCADAIVKYLYLEYECVDNSSGSAKFSMGFVAMFAMLCIFNMYY